MNREMNSTHDLLERSRTYPCSRYETSCSEDVKKQTREHIENILSRTRGESKRRRNGVCDVSASIGTTDTSAPIAGAVSTIGIVPVSVTKKETVGLCRGTDHIRSRSVSETHFISIPPTPRNSTPPRSHSGPLKYPSGLSPSHKKVEGRVTPEIENPPLPLDSLSPRDKIRKFLSHPIWTKNYPSGE